MSTLSLVRSKSSLVNPLSEICASFISFLISFSKSMRLAIEVSGELDHANRLTARGKELLGIHHS